MRWNRKLICALLVVAVPTGALRAQSFEEGTVEEASAVLHEIMAIPARGIPACLLADAQGVVIIPGMLKGGFIVGIRHGKGVMLTRSPAGEWMTPVFVTVTGGSIGFQAGLQATDVIAVFRNRQGVDRLMRGHFTIGADASVAAGPIGRDAAAATDAQLRAEILSYSRSRGLFAGIAIDGAALQVDQRATAAYYALKPGQPKGSVPASAIALVEQVATYAGPRHRALVTVQEVPMVFAPAPADEIGGLRTQLAESSQRLHKLVDPQWQQFLALPGEVYAQGRPPAPDALARCLDHYSVVASDPRYQDLSARPEFRETHALLLRYGSSLEGGKAASSLKLPPPPAPLPR